jgi:DNA-binding transcriptional ArsR family regulator
MSPLVRTDTEESLSMVSFRSSVIYEMMLSLGVLHRPTARHERWAAEVRPRLSQDMLDDLDFLYSRFENGVLLMELAVDYPDHHDVRGFFDYVEGLSTAQFLFYTLGRLAPPDEVAKVQPNMESLLSIITHAFPEGCSHTESRFRTEGYLQLVAEPEAHRARLLRLWRSYWQSFFEEESKRYVELWDSSIREKSQALAHQEPLDFVKTLSNKPTLPDQIPQGYPLREVLLVPSYFVRHHLMFYGYGSITVIYDCQMTERRREELHEIEEEIISTAKALGDKTRLRLLRWIASDPQVYGSKLAKLCHVSQPSVSRHLRILKEAGVIEEVPVDNHITYEVCRERLEALAPRLVGYLYEEE